MQSRRPHGKARLARGDLARLAVLGTTDAARDYGQSGASMVEEMQQAETMVGDLFSGTLRPEEI